MFKAVIFDMDGLLINSEPFWKDAEKEVFGSVGVHVTEEHAFHTSQMTTRQATDYWYNLQPWPGKSLGEIEQAVIKKVGQLIDTAGTMMPGVKEILEFFKQKNYPIGLATNSPDVLITKVLHKLGIAHYFDATSSSDAEARGKPSPDVYITTARKLAVDPVHCIAFEDSASGIRAALAAGMKAVAVPALAQFHDPAFGIADVKISCLTCFSEHHLQLLREKTRHTA